MTNVLILTLIWLVIVNIRQLHVFNERYHEQRTLYYKAIAQAHVATEQAQTLLRAIEAMRKELGAISHAGEHR